MKFREGLNNSSCFFFHVIFVVDIEASFEDFSKDSPANVADFIAGF